MKNHKLIVFLVAVITWTFCLSEAFAKVDMRQYNKIIKGMDKEHVYRILGKPQHVYSSATKVGVNVTRNGWDGDIFGSTVMVIFHDEKVFDKQQFGLKRIKVVDAEAAEDKSISISGLWENQSLDNFKNSRVVIAQDRDKLEACGYCETENGPMVWYANGFYRFGEIKLDYHYCVAPKGWQADGSYKLFLSKDGKSLTGVWKNFSSQTGEAQFVRVSDIISKEKKKSARTMIIKSKKSKKSKTSKKTKTTPK